MKTILVLSILAASTSIAGCSMTPTQQKWAAVGVSVVATGLLIAHRQDGGSPMIEQPSSGKNSCYPGHPCLPPGGK